MKNKIGLVPLDEIPSAIDAPTDKLIDLFRLITQMEHLCTEQNGIGLSACQVGIPWKLFVVQRGTKYEYYVNCEYTGIGEKNKSIEGCLSLKKDDGNLRRFEVDRYSMIRIIGKQIKVSNSPSLILEDIDRIETDLYAIVFQHEIDHQFKREKMIDKIGKEIEII
jgi:peptide deformylase